MKKVELSIKNDKQNHLLAGVAQQATLSPLIFLKGILP